MGSSLEKIKVVIFDRDILLKNIIYVDILSRILLYCNNEVSVDYYIYGRDKAKTKNGLVRLRIFFNRYVDNVDLDENLEDVLNFIRNNGICYINNNELWFKDKKLVDNNGEYTDDIRIANYLWNLSKEDNSRIIIINNSLNNWNSFEKLFKIKNICEVPLDNKINCIRENNDINSWRLSCVSDNLNMVEIEKLIINVNKIINSRELEEELVFDNTKLEKNLKYLLNRFSNIITEISYNYNIDLLIQYIEYLVLQVQKYIDEISGKKIRIEQLELLKNINKILAISLDLLGIIIPV